MLRQVFRLSDHSHFRAFPTAFNGQWQLADFVPDNGGGTAPDFNGIPY
jgi:hypothetical protein